MNLCRAIPGRAGLCLVSSRLAQLSLLVLMLAVASLFIAGPVHGNQLASTEQPVTETSVKAAFLYRFLSYVEWPAGAFVSADAPYIIAVIGASNMAEELKRLVAGRTAGARPIEVQQLGVNDSLSHVHVLYVGDLPSPQYEQVLGGAQQHAILSVTDKKEWRQSRSVIQFKPLGNRVSFDVALDIAEKSQLKISSRMLSVADQVRRSGS